MFGKCRLSIVISSMLLSISGHTQDTFVSKDIQDVHGVVKSSFDCTHAVEKTCIVSDTGLPAQVLPRSFSQIYKRPEINDSQLLAAEIPAFVPLYVFNQQAGQSDDIEADGWYEVGTNNEEPLGWIQAKDAIQWKQALIVSYTHPGDEIEGRKPIIMFDSVRALQDILDADDMDDRVERIYQDIEETDRAPSVISMEPKQFLDINKQLYFLPITAWKEEDVYGESVKLLEIAAAVPNERGATTVENKEFMAAAKVARTKGARPMFEDRNEGAGGDVNAEPVATFQPPPVDVIFVIDTTLSMQPYIDRTRNAIQAISGKIESNLPETRFGVVGYRDSTIHMPKIEYAAKNYTQMLVSAPELVAVLDTVKATRVDSDDEAEEVFAGIETAIHSNWREDSIHFIILIGDASGHDRGHPYNTTGTNHEDVKRALDQAGISLLAIHLRSNRKAAIKDRPIALQQYAYLSRIDGSNGQSALVPVDTTKPGFEATAAEIATRLLRGYQKSIDRLKEGESIDDIDDYNVDSGQPDEEFPDLNYPEDQRADAQTEQAAINATNTMLKMALIRYIGQAANPPKDIRAWVADRDLIDPGMRSLKVHVVLTQNQLSSLTQSLQQVLEAVREADSSQKDFFTSLQQIAGQAMKHPEDMAEAGSLAETGLLPKFIEGLPYKSDILLLDDYMFASMTSAQRSDLENGLSAKIKQYREILASPDLWQPTNPDDPNSLKIYPLPLDFLP